MPTLSPKDIDHIAHSARLCLDKEEKDCMQKALNKILHLVDQMDKTKITDVEPLLHPYNTTQALREDVVTEPVVQRTLLQKLAPQTEAGLYLVPVVIESQE